MLDETGKPLYNYNKNRNTNKFGSVHRPLPCTKIVDYD